MEKMYYEKCRFKKIAWGKQCYAGHCKNVGHFMTSKRPKYDPEKVKYDKKCTIYSRDRSKMSNFSVSSKKKLVTRLPNFPDRRIRYEFFLKNIVTNEKINF